MTLVPPSSRGPNQHTALGRQDQAPFKVLYARKYLETTLTLYLSTPVSERLHISACLMLRDTCTRLFSWPQLTHSLGVIILRTLASVRWQGVPYLHRFSPTSHISALFPLSASASPGLCLFTSALP